MYLKYNLKKGVDFNKRIWLKYPPNNFYVFGDKNKKIILGGKFYYFDSSGLKNVWFNSNPKKQLLTLARKYSPENFINNVEGEYWGVEINYRNQSLKIFSDKLKQLELYYFCNKDVFLLSDNIKEIINEVGISGYDKNSLINAILLYVPKGHMLFKGIHRLKYNETIKMTQGKIIVENFKDKDVEIAEYAEKDLLRYNKIFLNSVLSRASSKLNLVLSSGGWDSIMLLAILKERFGRNKVIGVTVKVVSSDGRCFNKFEVEKAKKIGKILGIKTDIVEVDYGGKELHRKFEAATENIFLNNLFFLAPASWQTLVDHIKNKYGKDAVVFQGEASDSVHNYGFSQYISLPHDNKNFLEYADKMKNYLYSPDFFKKVKDNSFLKDTVYKIFRYFNQNKEFIDVEKFSSKEKIYYYLLSFVFSDVRLPFRKIDNEFIKESALRKFNNWLKKEYFQEVVENINEDNLYYYFARLYADFHLQNHSIRIYKTGLDNVRFPYMDSNLFRFLYKMPQNFGRGLDFNRTKFPLKRLAEKILPEEVFEIIERGPHSYLSEVGKFNICNEYFLQGSIYEYIKKTIDFEKCRNIFDVDVFRLNEIESFVKKFKQGKIKNISQTEARFLLILTLLSIHA